MELKRVKGLINDMLDICGQLQDETFSEACSGIYNDIKSSKSIEFVISCARELMVFVNEAPFDDSDSPELRDEIEDIFNKIIEEYEEL